MRRFNNIQPLRLPAILLILISLNFATGAFLHAQSPQRDQDFLVSTEWLETNLNDSLLVLLHWGLKTAYDQEHIPGARYASVRDVLETNDQGLKNELPDEDQLQLILRSWGINNNSKVVICYQDASSIPRAARLYYTLDYAGLSKQVSILNGGLQAWKQEDRALSNEVLPFPEGTVDIRINDEVRVSRDDVLARLDKEGVVIIDARPPDRYYGNSEEEDLKHPGHIPGAINIPYYEVTRDDLPFVFKNTEELSILFKAYRIQEDATLILYCGTGIWASSLYFAASMSGYRVQFYDGSFQEWGNDESLPVK